jgi:hypothetical protein
VWQPEEIVGDVWVSLGLDTTEGVKEVTPRKIVRFDFVDQDDITGAFGRRCVFWGPFTFDVVVFAKQLEGGPLDICRNDKAQTIPEGMTAEVNTTWDGARDVRSQIRELKRARQRAIR